MKKVFLTLLFFLLMACSTLKLEKNVEYILTDKEFKKAHITLIIADDNILYGSSGINTYNAKYTIKGNDMSIGVVAVTLMAGEKDIMDLEIKYLQLLRDVDKIKIERNKIQLITDKGHKLIFKKVASHR